MIEISLKLAKCQQRLLNYEEAAVVLKTAIKTIKRKMKTDYDDYLPFYFQSAIEYAKLNILRYRLEDAHDV